MTILCWLRNQQNFVNCIDYVINKILSIEYNNFLKDQPENGSIETSRNM
jgi:hypothetical protein